MAVLSIISPGVEIGWLLFSSVTTVINMSFYFKPLYLLPLALGAFSSIIWIYLLLLTSLLTLRSLLGLLFYFELYLYPYGVHRTALAACIILYLVFPLIIWFLNLSVFVWCFICSAYLMVGSAKWIFLSIMILSSICFACCFFLIWLLREFLYDGSILLLFILFYELYMGCIVLTFTWMLPMFTNLLYLFCISIGLITKFRLLFYCNLLWDTFLFEPFERLDLLLRALPALS